MIMLRIMNITFKVDKTTVVQAMLNFLFAGNAAAYLPTVDYNKHLNFTTFSFNILFTSIPSWYSVFDRLEGEGSTLILWILISGNV